MWQNIFSIIWYSLMVLFTIPVIVVATPLFLIIFIYKYWREMICKIFGHRNIGEAWYFGWDSNGKKISKHTCSFCGNQNINKLCNWDSGEWD